MDDYELRHFCATHLLELGVSHADVALQLAHTDGGALVMSTCGHPSGAGARERLTCAYGDTVVPILTAEVAERSQGGLTAASLRGSSPLSSPSPPLSRSIAKEREKSRGAGEMPARDCESSRIGTTRLATRRKPTGSNRPGAGGDERDPFEEVVLVVRESGRCGTDLPAGSPWSRVPGGRWTCRGRSTRGSES
jgi:hypothetical protein